jgi:hypothetical protein
MMISNLFDAFKFIINHPGLETSIKFSGLNLCV